MNAWNGRTATTDPKFETDIRNGRFGARFRLLFRDKKSGRRWAPADKVY